jgi:hypothetical protein
MSSSNICFKRKGKHNTIYKYCIDKNSLSQDILIDQDDIVNEGSYSVVLGGMKGQIPIVAKFAPLDVKFTIKDFNDEVVFFKNYGGLPGIPNIYFSEILDVVDYEAFAGNNPKDSLITPPKKIGVIVRDRFTSSNDVKLSNQDRIRLTVAAIKMFDLKPTRDKIDAESKLYNEEMLNRELDLIEKQEPICTKELSKLILSQAYKLNFDLLSNLIHKQFYNVDIMKTMRCILYSVVKDELSYYELIKTTDVLKKSNKPDFIIFFQNLFKGKNKIFSTKYEKIKTLHEAIIGLMAANKVREVLPTFIWTYGITPCNMPILEKPEHNMFSGCTIPVNYKNDGDYIGMITEYIEGEGLGSFIHNNKLTEEYLYSIVLTILYSLKYAHEMTGFIHWDLHTDNIQMRRLDQDDYYIYLPNEKKYLWVGGHLATLFDFGLSSMKMNGKLYGSFEFMEYGLNPNVNDSIQNDILKLFSNLIILTEDDQKLLSIVEKMFLYFTQFDTIKELNDFDFKLNKNYAIFPNGSIYNINAFTPITIDNFIKFVEEMVPYDLSYLIETQQPGRVLSCTKGKCLSEVQLYEELFNVPPVDYMFTSDLKDIDPKDIPNVKMILTNYLDAIFNAVPNYEKKPVKESINIVFEFNSIRITQEKLNKIESFTKGVKGLEEVHERAKKIKMTVNELIHKFYDVVNKSISNSTFDKIFGTNFDIPEDQIESQLDLLKEVFQKSIKT